VNISTKPDLFIDLLPLYFVFAQMPLGGPEKPDNKKHLGLVNLSVTHPSDWCPNMNINQKLR
jgi:hypothetical protein